MSGTCSRRPLRVRRPPGAPSPLAPGGIGIEEQQEVRSKRKPVVEMPLADLRCKLAASVGFAARRLWRRADLESVDEVVLDLLCEALQRIGHDYRPKEGMPAAQALATAPSYIQELVQTLEKVATPGQNGAPLEANRSQKESLAKPLTAHQR